MPFDGVVTKNVVKELSDVLSGGRIEKIFQPEADEVILNIRAKGQNLKLLLTASANYPRIHITEASRENPTNPPVFCMLLRKHLSGGRITSLDFYDFERIVSLQIEATNELGDVSVKKLIIEIMGRHSNIILINSEGRIIDSIKHVDNEVSRVREVMPARVYELPPVQNKTSPEKLDIDKFIDDIRNHLEFTTVENYLLNKIKGFSPLLCREICWRSEIDGKKIVTGLSGSEKGQLEKVIQSIIAIIASSDFSPCIVYDSQSMKKPLDFHSLGLMQYQHVKFLPSINSVLDSFYSEKDRSERLKQKKSDLLKVLNNSIDRCSKKLSIQQETLRDVADREKLKLYGELITANIYCIPKGSKEIYLQNYYSESNESVLIPLDESLSPQSSAQRYFKQYAKAKSTFAYTSKQLEETNKELDYLQSVLHLLDNCSTLQEIDEVRQELIEEGYLSSNRKRSPKKTAKAFVPLHYKSSDGLDIFVGKNNKQNDSLTLKMSSSNDIWLHTRNIPGSHVIIKKARQDVSDTTLLEAAMLAAYHSKAKNSSNIPVDYTTVKNVKKPSGAKPGMVIYENFKTIIVTPDEEYIKKLTL